VASTTVAAGAKTSTTYIDIRTIKKNGIKSDVSTAAATPTPSVNTAPTTAAKQQITSTIEANIDVAYAIANTDAFKKKSYHDQLKRSDALKPVVSSIESMTTTAKQRKRVRRAGSTLSTVIVFSASVDASVVTKAMSAASSATFEMGTAPSAGMVW
jgi:hypothetical protein